MVGITALLACFAASQPNPNPHQLGEILPEMGPTASSRYRPYALSIFKHQVWVLADAWPAQAGLVRFHCRQRLTSRGQGCHFCSYQKKKSFSVATLFGEQRQNKLSTLPIVCLLNYKDICQTLECKMLKQCCTTSATPFSKGVLKTAYLPFFRPTILHRSARKRSLTNAFQCPILHLLQVSP